MPKWGAARIMDIIDSRIREACNSRGGCERPIHVARSNVATILSEHPLHRKPSALNADSTSEIHIEWRSQYGKVVLDTDPSGDLEYYVLRTVGDAWEEGKLDARDEVAVRKVMSWLNPTATRSP